MENTSITIRSEYRNLSIEEVDNELRSFLDALDNHPSNEEMDDIEQRLTELKVRKKQLTKENEDRRIMRDKVSSGQLGTVMREYQNYFEDSEVRKLNNKDMEIRALQKFISEGAAGLNAEERSALVVSQTGAVIPTEIYDSIITTNTHGNILANANVIKDYSAGTVRVPIATKVTASWKTEGSAISESNPTLTYLELGGAEIMNAVSFSTRVNALASDKFVEWMSDLCASGVNELLEDAFVNGDGSTTPHKGLANLTNIAGAVSATTSITAADLAEALGKLPEQYRAGAKIYMNSKTAFQTVALFKGTSEYAYNIAEGATNFLGKEIVINEHVDDDEIYIADPKQLYVRFADHITVDVDRSTGFLSAVNYMRCLAVVDFAWNEAAVAKVTL